MLIDRLLRGRGGKDHLGKVYLIYFLHRPLEQQLYFLVPHVGVIVLLSAVNLTVVFIALRKRKHMHREKSQHFSQLKLTKAKLFKMFMILYTDASN